MHYFRFIAALLYKKLVSLRNALFDRNLLTQYNSSKPVISVGNITAGGNGKTPLVIYLAKLLEDKRPVVLLRGYGGAESGPIIVNSNHSPAQVGDEALLIAHQTGCPVVVARSRVAGAKLIEAQDLGGLIILDDGFQHRWLARDLNLVSIDTGSKAKFEDLLNSRVLPLGMCREDPLKAFDRTDVIVLSNRGKAVDQDAAKKRLLTRFSPRVLFLESSFILEEIKAFSDTTSTLSREIIAFCGLASPDSFFTMLQEQGYKVLEAKAFPDHHLFKEKDVIALRQRHPSASLVCTSKDAVKISSSWDSNMFYTVGGSKVDQEAKLLNLIDEVIEKK